MFSNLCMGFSNTMLEFALIDQNIGSAISIVANPLISKLQLSSHEEENNHIASVLIDLWYTLRKQKFMSGGKLDGETLDEEAQGWIMVATKMHHKRQRKRARLTKSPVIYKKAIKWIPSINKEASMMNCRRGKTKLKCAQILTMFTEREVNYLEVSSMKDNLYDYLKSKYDIIAFPIFGTNPNHWSLLVWYIGSECGFVHYDSIKTIAGDCNKKFAKKTISYLMYLGIFPKSHRETIMTIPRWYPTQESDWECGHFVLKMFSDICGKYLTQENIPTTPPTSSEIGKYDKISLMSLWKD